MNCLGGHKNFTCSLDMIQLSCITMYVTNSSEGALEWLAGLNESDFFFISTQFLNQK